MKKILLLSPCAKGLEDPLSYPPLGLLYLASNMGESWKPYVLVLNSMEFNDYEYEYYGISVHSVSLIRETERLLRLIEKNNPYATVFLGGSAARYVQTYGRIRTVVCEGEGEKHFGIDTSNLDNLKWPARHLVPYEHIHYCGKVHHSSLPSTTMIATRGCVYNCSFCDRITHGRKFRTRSVGNVILEIEMLKKDYGIKFIRFVDDCITINRSWFLELCYAMQRLDIQWACMSRADTLNIEVLYAMKSAGCQEIYFGFESGSQKMLDLMNKKSNINTYKQIIQACRVVGIKSCAYMIFGFPGENATTVAETISFLEETKPDKSRLSEFMPFPNTDVWLNPKKYGVSIKPNYEDFWYFDNNDLSLNYDYIGQKEMLKLREKMRDYYNKNYKENWTNEN